MPRPVARGPRRSPAGPLLALAAVVLLALAAVLARALPAAAQDGAILEAAFPVPNATLAESPSAIELRFSTPVDPALVEVRLFGPGAVEHPLRVLVPNPADPRYVAAVPAAPLPDGAWTVAWSAKLANGPVVSDSWPFRIAPPAAPGAAVLDNDWPSAWATAARWLAILGLGLAAGALLASRLAAPHPFAARFSSPPRRAWIGLGAVGATVALLAIAVQPLGAALAAGDASGTAPSLGQAIDAMPPGWLPALMATVLLALAMLTLLAAGRAADRLPGWVDWLLLLPAAVALIGLAASGSQRPGPGWLALEAVHAGASALWVGLLVAALLGRRAGASATDAPAAADASAVVAVPAGVSGSAAPPRAPELGASARVLAASWWALAAALVSGLAVTLLALPRPIVWWESTWGWSLLAKSALVVAAALLLHLTRRRLAPVAAPAPVSPPLAGNAAVARTATAKRPVGGARPRAVAATLGVLALLGGSLMVLSAEPGVQANPTLAGIDLAAAAPLGPEGEAGTVDLSLSPAVLGPNTVVVRLAGPDGAALPPTAAPMVSVDLRPLDHQGTGLTVNPLPNPTGGFAVAAADLAGAGWWQADITLVPPDGAASRITQYFVLPDPNVTGRGPAPAGDPAARAVFDRGIAFFDGLRSVRYTQRLGDGAGSLFQSVTEVAEGDGGRPLTFRTVTPREELIIVGDTQWSRRLVGDGAWEERAAASVPRPSEWADVYEPAQGFRLGPIEEVGGEPSCVVTFFLPRGESNAPAWYAWWIGEETGAVHREAMISQRHYMLYTFSDFGADFGIAPPAARQGPPPAGTPAATPLP